MGPYRETLGEDGVVTSGLVCPPDSEGDPNVAHGGWTAAMLNDLVEHALLPRGEAAVIEVLQVVFHNSMSVELPLVGTALIERHDDCRGLASAGIELACSGALLASANAIMVEQPVDQSARHDQWWEERVRS